MSAEGTLSQGTHPTHGRELVVSVPQRPPLFSADLHPGFLSTEPHRKWAGEEAHWCSPTGQSASGSQQVGKGGEWMRKANGRSPAQPP